MIDLNVGSFVEAVVNLRVSVAMRVLVGGISDLLVLCIRILVILLLGSFCSMLMMWVGEYLRTLASRIFFFDVSRLGLSLFTLLLYLVSLLLMIHQA